MELNELRQKIDNLDAQLLELFKARMQICGEIGRYKKENGLHVLDTGRERDKLAQISMMAGDEMGSYARALWSTMFELSRAYQGVTSGKSTALTEKVQAAIEATPRVFPACASVACQGVEGAYSQHACEKLFTAPNILYFGSFDSVFSAIESGLCQYGVLPIENSTAGSVNKVYDLMMKHKFYIVRSVRLKVDHCLLANPGTKIQDLREVYSHDQALSQCAGYLKSLGVKVVACENTAEAARLVAESGRTDVAAIASRSCAALYGLENLADHVQDQDSNYTRFICISRQLEIYPGADRTSVMLVTAHKPGALYKILSCCYALGINLVKLESRPLPGRQFEFMFYFDLEASVYAEQFGQLLSELASLCERFEYLGSYTETV
jgi:chorismate mutase/prephenate dehydratase